MSQREKKPKGWYSAAQKQARREARDKRRWLREYGKARAGRKRERIAKLAADTARAAEPIIRKAAAKAEAEAAQRREQRKARRMNVVAPPNLTRKITIDNPNFGTGNLETIRRIEAVQTLRDDPLGQMHGRHQVDEAQYEAGRLFQSTWERAGRSGRIKGMDTSQEPVDGSPRRGTGITDPAINAGRSLDRWKQLLGTHGWKLVTLVLIDKRTLRECAQVMHVTANRANMIYVGKRFRECLDMLAQDMGLAHGL